MVKTFFFIITFLFSQFLYAALAKTIAETAVYELSNFDSDIITYLPVNKKIQASKKIYKGKTFGSFRKVKIGKSKYGFVSEVDIKLLAELKKKKARLKRRLIQLKKEKLSRKYVYLNRYIGLGFSFNRFTESPLNGESRSAPLQAFTVQAIGPGSLWPRVPLNLSVSYAKFPSYYKKFNSDKSKVASGYVFFGDISYPLVLSDFNYLLIYWSLGASFRRVQGTFFKKTESSIPAKSVAVSNNYWGGLFSIGTLWEFSKKLSLRVDARYHYNGGVFFEGIQTTLLFKY